MLKLHIYITPDPVDGGYIAECPDIPGCMSQGETEQEALANIHEAIELCLEVRRAEGMPLTVPVHEYEVAL